MTEEDLPKPILIEDLGLMFPTKDSKCRYRFGLYQCGLCGTRFKTLIANVKRRNTNSCGCYNRIKVSESNKKHGLSRTRLYRIWKSMENRVYNPQYKQYKYYGGRGITICDEWKNDFMSFYNWATTNGYSDELSIDRIDNDGNYCPKNCRWATSNIQNRNKRIRKDNTSGYKGVSYFKRDGNYRACIRINKKIYI